MKRIGGRKVQATSVWENGFAVQAVNHFKCENNLKKKCFSTMQNDFKIWIVIKQMFLDQWQCYMMQFVDFITVF